MNRRTAVSATIAALLTVPVKARDSNQSAILQSFIDTVIVSGDTSKLDAFVTSDVVLPDFNLHGIEAFREASDAGFASRESRFDDYTFETVSIVESNEWVHALIKLDTNVNGKSSTEHVCYVARFKDGLIAALYL